MKRLTPQHRLKRRVLETRVALNRKKSLKENSILDISVEEANEIVDLFLIENLRDSVFTDPVEFANSGLSYADFLDCMNDVAPTWLGIDSLAKAKAVLKMSDLPIAKSYLNTIELAESICKKQQFSEKAKKLRKRLVEEKHTWNDFSETRSKQIEKEYLPQQGEGDNVATQAVVATTKLIYKWFNDGDVYDNRYALQGWANDLSSYANWLYEHLEDTRDILDRIETISSKDEYTELLYDLYKYIFDRKLLRILRQYPTEGSIYDCDGPFEFYENEVNYEDDDY